MKRFIDLLLIAIIAGAVALLVRGRPERPAAPSAASRPLEIPRPRGSPEPPVGTEPAARPESPESAFAPLPMPPVAAPAEPGPSAVQWEGYSYRGGDQPEGGILPIRVEGADTPRADAKGRFRLLTLGGEVTLVSARAPAPAIALPPQGGEGVISVHQYPAVGEQPPLIAPSAALLVQPTGAAQAPRLVVCGTSTLPDGAEIAVRLIAADHALESVVLRVAGGSFAGEVPLSARDYHAGIYLLQFAWGPKLATRQLLAEHALRGGERIEGEFRRDVGVFFGTPESARRQEAEVRAFYRGALDDLEGMRDLLLVAGAQVRQKRAKLLDDPERLGRIRAHALASRFDRVFRGRKLDLDEWRRLIDEEIPARVRPYVDPEALPYATKHPQAAHNLVQLAQHVRKYSKLESTVIYAELRVPRHANDFLPSHDFEPEIEREVTLDRIENFAGSVRAAIGL